MKSRLKFWKSAMIFGKDKNMKSGMWLTVILVLCSFAWPAFSEQPGEVQDEATDGEVNRPIPWSEPDFCSPEHAKRLLEGIRRVDPQAADRLQKLYDEDIDAYREESKEYMRAHWREIFPDWRPAGPEDDRGPGRRDGHVWRERMKDMQKKHKEYLNWLKENYPEEANELEQVRQEDPGRYIQRVMKSGRKYGPVAAAAKNNPALAEVLKQDIELKDKRDEILMKLESAEPQEKDTLSAQLKDVISKRFDLIIKRRQLQQQKLLERLEDLKKRVKDSEKELEQWKTSKDKEVDARVKELLGQTEKFHWD
jgi:hypothetical protein